jgi:hypothetical protein
MPKPSASLTLSLYPRTGATLPQMGEGANVMPKPSASLTLSPTLPPNGGGNKRDAQTD